VLALLGCCPASGLYKTTIVASGLCTFEARVSGKTCIKGWGVCDGVARLVVEWTKLVSPSWGKSWWDEGSASVAALLVSSHLYIHTLGRWYGGKGACYDVYW
jgi:hypothetical protein